MSDSDDNLFDAMSSDGEDTDELIAKSKSTEKPIAKKKPAPKRRLLKKKKVSKSSIPDADDGSDDEAAGLFDADSEDDDKKPSASAAAAKKPPSKPLTKRERMEALRAKKLAASQPAGGSSPAKERNGDEKGYDSSDTYNSAEYVRTQDDIDFIDNEGEDEELVREYNAEQYFEDERPDELEEMEVKPRKGSSGSKKRARGPDSLSEADKKDQDNPIMQAVNRMKRKKKVVQRFEELKDIATEFLSRMERAADADDQAIKERRPGLKRLQMLPEVLNELSKTAMMRPLLESEFLIVVKRWLQPLPNGSLGNVTVRSKLIDAISNMSGENGIDNDDLKRSDFGKLVMQLYMHKKETPEMKRKLKSLIEQWSRRIFKKSGNMKELGAQAYRRGETGLAGIARAQAAANHQDTMSRNRQAASAKRSGDLGSVLSKGVKQARDLGKNRVRVPISKGFQYTIRPTNKTGDVSDKKTRLTSVKEPRQSLNKSILDKNKKHSKNYRSANISIEGRATK